jgi:hypothetical protein
MSTTLLAATLAMLLGAPGGPELRYLGRLPDGSRGRIQYLGRPYDVRAGDSIPRWGRVRAVTARALVLERALSEAEKQALEAEGLFAPDVRQVRIPLATGNVAVPAGEIASGR